MRRLVGIPYYNKHYIKDLKEDTLITISGEFNYVESVKEKCFDSNGNFLGFFEKENRTCEHGSVTKSASDWGFYITDLMQIDYEFYLVKRPKGDTISDAYEICRIYNDSFGFDLSVEYYDFNEHKKWGFTRKPFEVCLMNCSRYIKKNSFSSALTLDIHDYIIKGLKFKQENPEWAEEVDRLIHLNLIMLSDYYGVSIDKLKKSNDKVNLLVNRILTNRIN